MTLHAPKPRHRCQGDDAATGTRRPQGATGTGLLRTLIADPAQRGIPLSTLARDLLLAQIAETGTSAKGLIAKIRAELDALASRVA